MRQNRQGAVFWARCRSYAAITLNPRDAVS